MGASRAAGSAAAPKPWVDYDPQPQPRTSPAPVSALEEARRGLSHVPDNLMGQALILDEYNTCVSANDGSCDDDALDADTWGCTYGTDCTDCGPRASADGGFEDRFDFDYMLDMWRFSTAATKAAPKPSSHPEKKKPKTAENPKLLKKKLKAR